MLPLIAWLSVAWALSRLEQSDFSSRSIELLRNQTKDLFLHSWNAYAHNALPMDELRPLSCEGVGPDPDESHIERNDVMGNFSITLLDTVDMFAILGEDDLFEHYVNYIKHNVSFDQPHIVQVFESTIRAMGGLLSAHMYASVSELGHAIDGYDGHLLAKAYDLGLRLLPAFDSLSGIPHPRVHLQKGIVPINGKNITSTCSAGAGSLLLEFGLLSRLTKDKRFDRLARMSCLKIWSLRNPENLVGMNVDVNTGKWLDSFTSIGGGIDSFYECVLKYAILFNDKHMQAIWETAYEAIQNCISSGFYYHLVSFHDSSLMTGGVDGLTAFWAGVQVLAGEISHAIYSHTGFLKLWSNWAGIPEKWITSRIAGPRSISLEWYLLRPEFIESTYYLYQATNDPLYLQTGKVILEDLLKHNKVECGVAATQNVRTGEKSDRMDSFFLSETLKYLYLLFDPKHPLNRDSSNFIFTTEAHPFWSNPAYIEQAAMERFGASHKTFEKPGNRLMGWAIRLLKPWLDKRFAPGPEHMCETWPRDAPYSVVASWDRFYQLDEQINYTAPAWIDRGLVELEHDFNRFYVRNNAMCEPALKKHD